MIQLVGEYLFTQRKREEVRAATETATQVVSPLRNYDIDRMNQIVCDAGSALDARVLLLDENGTVLADSEDALNGRRLALKQVANVLAGASSDYAYYRSEALNACLHSDRDYGAVTGICVTRVISGGSLSGMVVYVSGAQDIYDDLVGVMRRVGVTLLAVFIVVGVLSVLIGRMFTHPVRDLSEGIQRMTKSDFKARVRVIIAVSGEDDPRAVVLCRLYLCDGRGLGHNYRGRNAEFPRRAGDALRVVPCG